MTTTLDDLERWLVAKETEHLEFKEAKSSFPFEDIKRYVVALGNEGGGRLVLGISPKLPRRVVGSTAYRDVGDLKKRLWDTYRRAFEVDEVTHSDGRVVVIHIPPRPMGVPLNDGGAYLMRLGESVVPMPPERLRAILDEAERDFSAALSPATTADLDVAAIEILLQLWARKSGDASKRTSDARQALVDLDLIEEDQVTWAGLILLGKASALKRHLADAEVVWEFRSDDGAIEHEKRFEWRSAFLLAMDEIWKSIDARNDVQHFQEGLFIRDIPVLREDAVREAVLNAVCHRDYRQPGSIFINQWPRRLTVSSPGGLLPGITVENLVSQRQSRNRRLAETLQHIGLVERSGQGMDKIFRSSIEDGKLPPDFGGTDGHNVVITLFGEVQDPRFVHYLERIGQEKLRRFTTHDFIVLDHVRRDVPVPAVCQPRIAGLIDLGVIERVSKKLILSKGLYAFLGERGAYTRVKGLDRETQKALLEKHLREVATTDGSPLSELRQVLPSASPSQVPELLRELREEGRAEVVGRTRAARWFAVQKAEGRKAGISGD